MVLSVCFRGFSSFVKANCSSKKIVLVALSALVLIVKLYRTAQNNSLRRATAPLRMHFHGDGWEAVERAVLQIRRDQRAEVINQTCRWLVGRVSGRILVRALDATVLSPQLRDQVVFLALQWMDGLETERRCEILEVVARSFRNDSYLRIVGDSPLMRSPFVDRIAHLRTQVLPPARAVLGRRDDSLLVLGMVALLEADALINELTRFQEVPLGVLHIPPVLRDGERRVLHIPLPPVLRDVEPGMVVDVSRDRLQREPFQYLRELSAGFLIRFEGESGIGSGLRRDFVRLLAEAFASNQTHFTRDEGTGLIQPKVGSLSPDERLDFRNLGRWFRIIIQDQCVTGTLFPLRFFKALLAVPERGRNEGERRALVRAFLEDDPHFRRFLPLCDQVSWNEEGRALAGALCVETPGALFLLLESYVPVEALRSIAFGFHSLPGRSYTPQQLADAIHGRFDRRAVADALPRIWGLNAKITWLREWILESDANAKAFLVFVTGNSAYRAGALTITVEQTSGKFLVAHVCSRTVEIPGRAMSRAQFREAVALSVAEGTFQIV